MKKTLTLYDPAPYQIKVPGALDLDWADGYGKLAITIEQIAGGTPVSTISGEFDQAGLHSLLRRLYAFGLPLLSVVWGNMED